MGMSAAAAAASSFLIIKNVSRTFKFEPGSRMWRQGGERGLRAPVLWGDSATELDRQRNVLICNVAQERVVS